MAVTVKIKNFQSIRSSTIIIDGLTVVTGSNNSGKTAVMRAIRGVFQNTPGTSFVRHGAAKSSVELTFDDGRSIRWEKGDKIKPTYYIDGGKPIHPGRGIPEELAEFGVEAIKAGDQLVWPQVAPQFTGQVFLLDQPGSVLAEAVANVERVGKLNTALKMAEKDGRTTIAELKVRRTDRDKHEDEFAQYDGLDDALTLVNKTEEAQKLAKKVDKAVQGFRQLQQQLSGVQQQVSHLEGVEAIELVSPGLATQLQLELVQLEALRNSLDQSQAEVDRLGGLEDRSLDAADPALAEKLRLTLGSVRGLSQQHETALEAVGDRTVELADGERRLVQAEAEVTELLGDLGECPICGTMTGLGGEHDHVGLAD